MIDVGATAPTYSNPTDFRIMLGLSWGNNPFTEVTMWNYWGGTWDGHVISHFGN